MHTMKLKNIKVARSIKDIYEIEFEDGTFGIMEIDPNRWRPIIDGKMCNGCKSDCHCLYWKIGLPGDECPENVIRRIEDE